MLFVFGIVVGCGLVLLVRMLLSVCIVCIGCYWSFWSVWLCGRVGVLIWL